MPDLEKYKLIIFDLDGTLAENNADEFLPDVQQWFAENSGKFDFAMATNQGGVGLRHWMGKNGFGEPDKYPTEAAMQTRLYKLVEDYPIAFYVCYAYQSKKTGQWSPTPADAEGSNFWKQEWRKPSPGMLLAAMLDMEYAPMHTLMVGDGDEDSAAAHAAGCDFMHAADFFGRNDIPF